VTSVTRDSFTETAATFLADNHRPSEIVALWVNRLPRQQSVAKACDRSAAS